jgi:hypothetical protein
MEAQYTLPVANDNCVQLQYISIGANRNPASADSTGNLVFFGAGRSIALWDPTVL